MIRRLTAVVVAGLLLGGCGSVSASQAISSWIKQSGYSANSRALLDDARRAAGVLRSGTSTAVQLHTICGVLYTEVGQMQSSLPSPDSQANALLDGAYRSLASGATNCYGSSTSPSLRTRALSELSRGGASLEESSARLDAAAQS